MIIRSKIINQLKIIYFIILIYMFKSETHYTKFDGKKHKDVKSYVPKKKKKIDH